MVKIGICILIQLLITCATYAQAPVTMVYPETCDTAEVDRCITRSKQFTEKNDDSVHYLLNRAVNQSYHCQFNERIVKSLTEMAIWHFGHDLDKCIYYCRLAVQEYANRKLAQKKPQLIYTAYNILAKAFETKGVIDSAAYYYYLLSDVIDKGTNTDPEYAVAVYNQMALFWLNSNWDINNGYIEPTRIFIEKEKAAEAHVKPTSPQAYISYMLQGSYFFCTKQYDSARYYYLEFLRLRQRMNTSNVTWESAMYLNVSETYMAQNNPDAALPYLQKTLALRPKLVGQPRYLLLAYLYLSKAFYQQKKYFNSIQAFETVLNDAASANFLTKEVIEGYQVAGDAAEALGNMNKAVLYKNTYIKLHDSLMKKDKLDMMNRLQVQYRMAEKDKELAEKQLIIAESVSRVRKKNFWITGISMVTIFLVVVFFLWRRAVKHKQHLQQEEINSLQQKMEIAHLHATIEGAEQERKRIARELHDGIGGLLAAAKLNFETVKTTYHLHNKPDYTDGLSLLSEASAELRKTAHNMMPEILLQEGLVEAVAHFCTSVSRNHPTHIHFQLFGAVQKFSPTFELAVYRIVQEVVHNILKHAKATEALVQMSFSEHIFDLSIEDNGIGIPDNVRTKSGGMGLRSIADRVQAINGNMSITNLSGKGTGIYLEVPLQTETATT